MPAAAIHLLPEGVQNTVQEVQLIGRELRNTGDNRVILVTSRPHTRRLRATWRVLVGDTPQAVETARAVRLALGEAGFELAAFAAA